MTIFYARGSPEEVITPRDAKEALDVVFEKLGKRCACVRHGDEIVTCAKERALIRAGEDEHCMRRASS